MSSPIAVYIRRDIYEWCETKVSQGRFRTFSDILDYAMGFYLDSITTGRVKTVMKIAKRERVRKSVRVNEHVLEGLMGTGLFDRSEIADYALDFYRTWLENDG